MWNFVTLVSGFGRCGTSLVMQMLEVAGMPMTGEYPSFETPMVLPTNGLIGKFMAQHTGHAVKVLDPHRGYIPQGPAYRIIWIDRDVKQQAKSHRKFVREMSGVRIGRRAEAAVRDSYLTDRPRALANLAVVGSKAPLMLRFKDLIEQPLDEAMKIVRHLDLCHPEEAEAMAERMASVVVPRSPDARRDMVLEHYLLLKRRRQDAQANGVSA